MLQAEDEIYATTKGEVFCLDPGTGQIRWHNPLKGMGTGLVSIAGPGIQGNQAALVQKHKRDQEMAAAAQRHQGVEQAHRVQHQRDSQPEERHKIGRFGPEPLRLAACPGSKADYKSEHTPGL